MAVRHCSNAQDGGWHVALQKNRAEKTWLDHSACEKNPHSATTTHCLCGQANSGDHCHFSSMHSPHPHRKTSCSLEKFWPINFSQASVRAWFAGERRISEDLRLSSTVTFHKSSHLRWSLHRLPVYPTGTSKRFLLVYKASRLRDVPGWVFICAAERRDIFGSVASWSDSGYKGASDALSELGML